MKRVDKIKFFFIIIFLIFSFGRIFSQGESILAPTGIYFTYNDYVQHKMKPMGDYVTMTDSLGKIHITFINGGKKQKFECSKIWGFQYKYKLFRCDVEGRPPARVIGVGKIVYYENGFAHLEILKNDLEEGNFSKGAYCYLSNNLLGKMIAMPEEISNDLYKDVELFKARHKQYKKLFDCIESEYNTSKIFKCVKNFEQGN